MDEKRDQQEIEQIEQILRGIAPNAYEVIKMILALEQENLHKSEPLAWNTVRDEMPKKVEGIA
ncbi:hypothetical protein DI270_004500 [Microbispora triticiradicis]|uniref:Uncharacterized protein n=1 Tax=Microbispora triticiradicis TaxID=2200763 RepID=A0ABX9LQB0_9ACTN|nr:hypothetical protein [Microbispora triticiradicis]RGA06206.1 hypothetical protein DI270_004500 [Microbispora triticiradicis]